MDKIATSIRVSVAFILILFLYDEGSNVLWLMPAILILWRPFELLWAKIPKVSEEEKASK